MVTEPQFKPKPVWGIILCYADPPEHGGLDKGLPVTTLSPQM